MATQNCDQAPNTSVVSFNLSLDDFIADVPVTIWSGSGDPGVHTVDPLTEHPVANVDSDDGDEAPYTFETESLKDLGSYVYWFTGTYTEGSDEFEFSPDFMEFVVDNSPPDANPSVSGTKKVGNTLEFEADSSDDDHSGSSGLHHEWVITSKPTGAVATLSSTTSASPSMELVDKHDIGDWSVRVKVADTEGELKEFSTSFTVLNQPPTLSIVGATTIDALENVHLEAEPDTDADGEDIDWVWDILEAPPGAVHSIQSGFSTSQVIDFATGPDEIGTWRFRCTATDERDASVSEEVVVEVISIPPEITLEGETEIDVGTPIQLETTTLEDSYGNPLVLFRWELLQVPVSAGVPLGNVSSNASLTIATGAQSAGTWKFRLTVEDEVGDTAEEEVSVLVDAEPTAEISGPEQTGSLALPLDLDGGGSLDPDSPSDSPDHGHLHTGPVEISPGIVVYEWSVEPPPELYGEYFSGPVADVLGVNGSGPALHVPSGSIEVGTWLFSLTVRDGEENEATATHTVQVLDESLPPVVNLSPPRGFLTDANGVLLENVVVSGEQSFDLDNLLTESWTPGLGITNYSWQITAPVGCPSAPFVGSDPGASIATLFSAGTVLPQLCLGAFGVTLTATDDDAPNPKQGVNSTIAILGNCAGAVCIDHPTQATPQFVKFSDKTDVLIYYHLSSTLYGDPAFAAGLRLRLDIFHESDLVNPAFNKAWDVDVLPSGFLTVHWSGFTNGNQRPEPGKYTIGLALVDGAGNVTSYEAVEPESIWIQTLNIQVAAATDEFLNAHGLPGGTDALNMAYAVTGLQPGDSGYDEIRFRITDPATSGIVFENSHYGPFTGQFSWNGGLGGGAFIQPGEYELVLELLENGALLGTSTPHVFHVYEVDIDLAGMSEADELTPGAVLQEGKTKDVTVSLLEDATALPGSTVLKTDDEPGTLSAADGATAVDIEAGADVPTSALGSPKTFTVKGEPGAAIGKTTISFSYQPPGTSAVKKAVARAAVTVVRARVRAVSSDPTKQHTDGVFVEGSRTPVPATPANLPELRYKMRPLKIEVGPDLSGATVLLEYESGSAANVELFESIAPYSAVALPKTWTTADFASHKLERTVLAYGKAFGEVVLKLSYVKGGATLAEEKIKLRVAPFPGLVGVAIPGEFPFFRVVRTVNEGTPVKTALDPSLHKERLGKSAAVFVVAHKTAAEWAADPTLTDVTGSADVITISAGSIAGNVKTPWASASAGQYDVVYDFGNFPEGAVPFATDNRLDPGDILDSSAGSVSVFVEPSFTASGPAATSKSDYGMVAPITTIPVLAGYDGLAADFTFRLRGQVVYPTVLGGSHPLVVFAHGNHVPLTVKQGVVWVTVDPDLTSDENFKGYTYLQEHLASRGFITLSVDLDETYGDPGFGYPDIAGYGIGLRAWIVLKNIEALLTDASIAGGALTGKIDTSRIYLIGHSRGGEAVHMAVHLLKAPAERPAGGVVGGFLPSGIKGIVSLAPMSATIDSPPPPFSPLLPADTPFLLLYGSADGDVNGASSTDAMPFRHYDRATADRYAIRIEGGNHNFFNTSWPASDAAEDVVWGGAPGDLTSMVKVLRGSAVGSGLTTGLQQRDVATAYITAFLEQVDTGDVGAHAYFLEPPAKLRPLGVSLGVNLYGQSNRNLGAQKFVLDDFETNPATTTSASGETVSTTAASVSEEFLRDTVLGIESETFNRFFQETRGVLFSWSGGAKAYVQNLAGPEQDLRGAQVLSFRVAQQPDPPAVIGPMTLQVELEDAAANKKAVRVTILDTVPGIYEAHVPGVGETTSAAFATFRIPISAFATDGATLDLAHVAKIRFKLAQPGDSASGRVAIDDLEIEK